MPVALNAAAGDEDRQVLVVVEARVAHAAAVENQRVVEQRAVAVRSVAHPLEEVREQRHMELVDLRELQDLLWIVAVVADRVVRVCDADLRIRAVALLTRELEGSDPRDVRLEGENLQVEHQLRVIGELRRHAHRPIEVRRLVLGDGLFGPFDLTLDLAHALDVLL